MAFFACLAERGMKRRRAGVRRIRQERIRTDERLALERASAEGLGAWMHPAIPMKRPPCIRSPQRHHRHSRARGDAFIPNGVSSYGRRGPGARKRGRAGPMGPSNPGNEAATLQATRRHRGRATPCVAASRSPRSHAWRGSTRLPRSHARRGSTRGAAPSGHTPPTCAPLNCPPHVTDPHHDR